MKQNYSDRDIRRILLVRDLDSKTSDVTNIAILLRMLLLWKNKTVKL